MSRANKLWILPITPGKPMSYGCTERDYEKCPHRLRYGNSAGRSLDPLNERGATYVTGDIVHNRRLPQI